MPQIAVLAEGKGGKQTRSVLGTAFDDQTFCCGVNQLWVGVKDGKSLIRVGADSWVRECSGGTATTTIDLMTNGKAARSPRSSTPRLACREVDRDEHRESVPATDVVSSYSYVQFDATLARSLGG